MPLSEHEERALAEIARHLEAEDPRFVAAVANTTLTRVQVRRLLWAAAGFLLGLVTLLGLTFHIVYGVIGFTLMLVAVLVAAGALRALGAGAGDLVEELRRSLSRRQRS